MSAIDLTAMLEKRREVLGSKDKFEVTINDKSFFMVAPEIASEEWNEQFDNLNDDIADGVIARDDFRAEFFEMLLGDQSEEFQEEVRAQNVDPFIFATWALKEHANEVGKTQSRMSSNRSQRRSKRR